MRSKDDEISKLREDNQNMFKDLKDYSESEETLKMELLETKQRKQENEIIIEELREKTHT